MANRRLYIIAGCNGAGKTTATKHFLPSILDCRQWVNADEIAYGLSPFSPESVAVQAGRLMLQRIDDLLRVGATFAIETTLAGRNYRHLVARAHERDYSVELVFFLLPSPALAIQRVAHRVSMGGHNVPDDVVTRRYYAGLRNLKNIYLPIVDQWNIYLYKKNGYVMVEKGEKGQRSRIVDMCEIHSDNPYLMENQEQYLTEKERRMLECCNKAVLDMITECALHDQLVVMTDADDNPIWVRAREVLEKNPGLKLADVDYTPVEVDIHKIIQKRNR